MEFFNSAVDTLQTIVVGLGGALCVWGGINLLEGYGQDNPGSKSQGVKMCIRDSPWHTTLVQSLVCYTFPEVYTFLKCKKSHTQHLNGCLLYTSRCV